MGGWGDIILRQEPEDGQKVAKRQENKLELKHYMEKSTRRCNGMTAESQNYNIKGDKKET